MNALELREMLRKVQEKKGYFFNRDEVRTIEIIEGLILNRERYGYMACPCRLASGNRSLDADIICPCAYREADISDYGSCFCNLYVSSDWNNDIIPHSYVPERRPPEKSLF